jgi:predicted metal-dependent phosphoesterase TrpH
VSARRLATLVVVVALVIGSAADRLPARRIVRADGYWILSGDFHVHAFPGDGALAPWALRWEAARAGLDVIAVTNHNQAFAGRLGAWLAGFSGGPLVVPGEEVTTPRYHLIALGIGEQIAPDPDAARVIAAVHAQHGVAIAAHPGARFNGYSAEAIARLDGVEAAHVADTEAERRAFVDFYENARRGRPQVAAIGSSDFHNSPSIGSSRTYVFTRTPTVGGVLEAIRNGWTVAQDPEERLYGPDAFVEMIRRTRPDGRSDPHPWWRRASLTLAWVGVLGLLMLGPGAIYSRRRSPR